MFYKSDVIRQKMNEAGQAGRPFLFGVTFEGEEGFFLPHPLMQDEVLFDIGGKGNAPNPPVRTPSLLFEAVPEPFDIYRSRFEAVMEGLQRGNSYLTNLTIRTPLRTSLTLSEVFLHSEARYRLLIPGVMVCFSPECFVTMHNQRIATFPMKGTIDASLPGAREIILSDPKERAEHNTIVDLLRNDLSYVATDVNVKRFRYLETVRTSKGEILQVSSEIEGTLPDHYWEQLGSLLFKLLPAGSVSGAPKEATLRLIRAAESKSRGYYCGVAGYYDGESLDTFVMIRFIEQRGEQQFFRSGGGITAQSDCRREYDEAIQKVYLPFQSS